ncbi:MAG: efflux RND transporter periplasmic adaptor subunit [Flavobacteriales bacterium]|nr:efflux RND transporter periplasmic adaptor subunit [Flavobacteriales bacterium]
MNKYVLFPLLYAALMACQRPRHDEKDTRGHDHGEMESLTYTLYTDSVELFVEFKPLVVGQETHFAAHFTRLGSLFTPVDHGAAAVSLSVLGAPQYDLAEDPDSPGIFRLTLTPAQEGPARLVFTLHDGVRRDTLAINDATVHATAEEAQHAERPAAPAGDITFLKEQAWRIPFSLELVRSAPFARSVRVAAEVEPAVNAEEVVTARTAGIVQLAGEAPLEGMVVTKGRTLFTLSSQGVVGANAGATLQQARNDLERAKADLERTESLYKDRLVTQDEMLRARNAFANAEVLVNQSGSAQTVSAGINGYVRTLRVREGQFVQPGEVLATIATNDRLSIHADVPLRAFGVLGAVADARIRTMEGKVHTMAELKGRVQSVGRAADGAYIPVRLEVNGAPGVLPGAVIEAWLLSPTGAEALTIPLSAVLEQEGRTYCYVQTAGETMDKRVIALGGNDGLRVEVKEGLHPGERVVSIGALDVKLATASGTMPAHGHEH